MKGVFGGEKVRLTAGKEAELSLAGLLPHRSGAEAQAGARGLKAGSAARAPPSLQPPWLLQGSGAIM